MDLIVLIIGIVGVILISFLASVLLTWVSRSNQVIKASLATIVQEGGREGVLYDLAVEAKIMDFDGLDNPSTLILVDGDARIQATDPDNLVDGASGTSLAPGETGSLTGSLRSLGTHHIVATYEYLPSPHLRIRGSKKL